MSSIHENNRRIAKNTLFLYFRLILTMCISLYTSRVILHTLGEVDWGIYNVVGGVVFIFSSINWALTSATQRFLNFELGRGDFIQLKKVFNATVSIHFVIGILIVVLAETVGLWFLTNKMVFPPDRWDTVYFIFHFSVATFFIGIIQVPFGAIIGAHERMGVYALMSILEVSLKLIIVFMLGWAGIEKLKLYAVLVFIVAILVNSIYRIYAYSHFRETRFALITDVSIYRGLFSFSAWSLLGSLVYAISTEGINILINNFFGAAVNAAKGIAMQLQGILTSFTGGFQGAATPQIVKYYASGDKANLEKLVFRSAKFSLFLVYLLGLPIVIELPYILKLWLVKVPEYTYFFALFVILGALTESTAGPLFTAIQATGKIKWHEIAASLDLSLTFGLTFLLFSMGYPPHTTTLVGIFLNVLLYIVKLIILQKELRFSISNFLRQVHLRAFPIIILSPILPLLIHSYFPSSFMRLLLVFVTAVGSTLLYTYMWGLDNAELRMAAVYSKKIKFVFQRFCV